MLEALIVRVERGLMRRLPAGLVVAANAQLHRWKGEPELRELPRLVRPGTVAIDAGAHFGTYSHALARLVGTEGAVLAIEPVAEDAALLRAAARQLRLPIEVHEVALSDESGTAELRIPALHGRDKTALSTLEARDAGGQTRTVTTVRLDDLLATETRPVSFIKIDVEGHEAAVLAGARETLAAHRPTLLIEIEGRFRGEPVTAMIDAVLAHGYAGAFIDADGHRQPVSAFDPAVHQDQALDPLDRRYIHNFIFTPT